MLDLNSRVMASSIVGVHITSTLAVLTAVSTRGIMTGVRMPNGKEQHNSRFPKTAATTDKQPSAAPKKLTIANKLKTAFMTNLHISEADIEKIIASASAQGN